MVFKLIACLIGREGALRKCDRNRGYEQNFNHETIPRSWNTDLAMCSGAGWIGSQLRPRTMSKSKTGAKRD